MRVVIDLLIDIDESYLVSYSSFLFPGNHILMADEDHTDESLSSQYYWSSTSPSAAWSSRVFDVPSSEKNPKMCLIVRAKFCTTKLVQAKFLYTKDSEDGTLGSRDMFNVHNSGWIIRDDIEFTLTGIKTYQVTNCCMHCYLSEVITWSHIRMFEIFGASGRP